MQDEGWSLPWRSLVAIQPGGTNTPLFMVPGVGGNVLSFAHLSNLLGPDQPFYGTQSRGLDGTEEPFRCIEDMARAYIGEIREIQPKGPYMLGGACMGGVVAFEMAQQLAASGEEVAVLALIEIWLPRSLSKRRDSLSFSFHPMVFVVQGVVRHLLALRHKSPREWSSYVRARPGIVKEMIDQKDIYRGDRSILYQDAVSAANFRAMAEYLPRPYKGRLHLFLASDRPVNPARDTRLEWASLAEGGYSLHRINAKMSGDLSIHPYVTEFADKLRSTLSRSGSPEC